MDGKDYLNQISITNKPIKKPKSGIFSSKFFLVGAIGVGVLILIIILVSILGGGKSSGKEKLFSLILHMNNTSEVIENYQPYLKSSDLRGYSASLNGILSDTSKRLVEFATSNYGYKEKDVPKKITEQENAAKDELEAELFKAKINGVLDRTFTHKMIYEISLITSYEAQISKSIKDATLNEDLTRSSASLENLYNNFNNFSESK